MAARELSAMATSALCSNMAMLLSAGIQVEEALSLLCADTDEDYAQPAQAAHAALLGGATLAEAVRGVGLPFYAAQMLAVGESTGRLERVLNMLAAYYARLDRTQNRLRGAVVYPAVLLGLMAVVLGVLALRVLPVFTGVYQSLAGDLVTSAYGYVGAANAIARVALVVVIVLAAVLLAGLAAWRTQRGRAFVLRCAQRLPASRTASLRQAQAQFTGALAACVASGLDVDAAVEKASALVEHKALAAKLAQCRAAMAAGAGLGQAVSAAAVYEPFYARMLQSGLRSGNYEQVLTRLAAALDEDADARTDAVIDAIEPAMAAFLALSVGFTLLAVMLPLVGILSSVG